MKKKIAWVLESGEEHMADIYVKMLSQYDVHFHSVPCYMDPSEDYSLVIMGLDYESNVDGCLDLIDDIRLEEGMENIPVMVLLNAVETLYESKIKERGVSIGYKPFASETINHAINLVIGPPDT